MFICTAFFMHFLQDLYLRTVVDFTSLQYDKKVNRSAKVKFPENELKQKTGSGLKSKLKSGSGQETKPGEEMETNIKTEKEKRKFIMKKKLIAAICTAALMTAALTGCGSNGTAIDTTADTTGTTADTTQTEAADASATDTTAEENTAADLSGTISLAGSTSMEKLCEAMSESFMEKYPGITVTVEYTGSGAGLESLASGSVDIGDASRSLKDEEKAAGSVENIVAIDGIAVIEDKDNGVTNVSAEDLAKIYKGEVKNWSELGGKDEAIVVIGREAGSGTRDAFEELLDIADSCAYAQELDSTGAVLAKVASTPGAIGYVSLDVVDDTVTAVSIDGTAPTEEQILAGNYLLSRPFVMATKGEISEQNDLVKTWFDYIASEDGKNVIKQVGLIIPE